MHFTIMVCSGTKEIVHFFWSSKFATLERRRDWTELTFAKTSGMVTGDSEKNDQYTIGTFPVTTLGTIEGFLRKWALLIVYY